MGILSSSLLAACVATAHSDMDQQACDKATQAAAQQSGALQYMDSVEDRTVKFFNKKALENVGQSGMFAVAATYFIARTVSTRSVSIPLPNFGLCKSLKAEVNTDQGILRAEWNF